ncbi:MAG: hypothetical protein GF311_21640 [Candidatus Lokiarchaeota archaeon]|nr:hypothetical protein [Candidatus Lokiarchaeota archaeon]
MSIKSEKNSKLDLDRNDKSNSEEVRSFESLVRRILIQYERLHELKMKSQAQDFNNKEPLTKTQVKEILKKELFS